LDNDIATEDSLGKAARALFPRVGHFFANFGIKP
jgi:hypothetical protein